MKLLVHVQPHWGRVTHICVGNLTIIGPDNGLSPGRRQAIIWTNAGILLIGPLGTNFCEISIEIHILSFKKMHLKMSSGKWRPFCLGLNELSTSSFGSFYNLHIETETKWLPFFRYFEKHFLEWKLRNLKENLIEISSLGSNWQWCIIGSHNGLVPNRQQAIIWTDDGLVYVTEEALGFKVLST